MTICLHQPYFSPWLGYFNKIHNSDVMVFLDNVNFRKRFYHDRVKIIDMNGDVNWLNLKCADKINTKIIDVKVSSKFYNNCIKTIMHSYSRGKFFDSNREIIFNIFKSSLDENSLGKTNIKIIKKLSKVLCLNEPIYFESAKINTSSDPTLRIIEICQKLGCKRLLVGNGKSSEIHDFKMIHKFGIETLVLDYLEQHPIYSQSRRRNLVFESGLSVIDSIFNQGLEETHNSIVKVKL